MHREYVFNQNPFTNLCLCNILTTVYLDMIVFLIWNIPAAVFFSLPHESLACPPLGFFTRGLSEQHGLSPKSN